MSYTVQKWDNNTAEIAYKLYAFDTDFIIEKESLRGTSTESTYYSSNVSRETITDAWAARTTKTYDYTLKDKLVDNRFNRNFLAFEDAYACNLDDSARKGININVADFPLLWLEGNGGTGYYGTYKGDTFLISGSGCVFGGGVSDYDAVIEIDVRNQSLTTNFNFLDEFNNLETLYILNNPISLCDLTGLSKLKNFSSNDTNISTLNTSDLELIEVIDSINTNLTSFAIQNKSNFINLSLSGNSLLTAATIENNTSLRILNLSNCDVASFDLSTNTALTTVNVPNNNNVTSCNLSNLSALDLFKIQNGSLTALNTDDCVVLRVLNCFSNDLTDLSFANNVLLYEIYTHNNQLTAATNSQLLIDLDTHNLSNGYFQSSIFGGGTLTTAGLAAKASLQAKGWTIVGL